jgi:hypothetical protein
MVWRMWIELQVSYSSLEYKPEVIELSRRFLLEAMKVKDTR